MEHAITHRFAVGCTLPKRLAGIPRITKWQLRFVHTKVVIETNTSGIRVMAQTAASNPKAMMDQKIRRESASGSPGSFLEMTDAELVWKFVHGSEEAAEAAFSVVVNRYATIVHRVCFDVLGSTVEVQDAAQAVFLVLARKARGIRKPESLGPWLHGVALRVARRARSQNHLRKIAERKKAELMLNDAFHESEMEPILRSELHEEIDRLPENYRRPIILCYLQGLTQLQAAKALDWPLGTVQTRLHRGKERLRERLSRQDRRGSLEASLNLGALLALKSIPTAWVQTTSRAAVRFASGRSIAGLAAPKASVLATSVLKSMFLGWVKASVLTANAVLLLGVGLYCFAFASKQEPRKPSGESTPSASTRVEDPPRMVDTSEPADVVEKTIEPRKTRPMEPEADVAQASTKPNAHGAQFDGGKAEVVSLRVDGKELFERTWVKDDRRSRGGDGLGPVFNGRSCVDCHNLGGSGGAGGLEKNIEIATLGEPAGTGYSYGFSMDFERGQFSYWFGNDPANQPRMRSNASLSNSIHPGFRESKSIVLHKYGTDASYQAWRDSIFGLHGRFQVKGTQRNPPALFGAGLIDSIPDGAIEAASKRKTNVKGRLSRLSDGRIGRFGWKAQTATLEDFVLSAAAGEMGLEVPGRKQAADPRLAGLPADGLDMDEKDSRRSSIT